MNIPDNLVYAETHEWVKVEADGTIVVGITDFGQDQLGPLVYVSMPTVGKQVKKEEECGIVESSKTASDLHAPVDGEVTAINSALEMSPEAINDAPYDQWIFKIKPNQPVDTRLFLNANAYKQMVGL